MPESAYKQAGAVVSALFVAILKVQRADIEPYFSDREQCLIFIEI